MKAIRRGFVAAMLLTFTLPVLSHAQAANLAGKWRITWLENGKVVGKPNTINMTEKTVGATLATLSGTYIADSGEQCTVSGTKSNDSSRQLDMKVTCATWSISITGTIAMDGQQINGGYIRHLSSGANLGDYVMDKIICMLPEGCGN